MGFSFLLFFPAALSQLVAGREEAKNLAGKKFLRLIQIRLATSSLDKITPASQDNSASAQIPVRQTQSAFHPTYNESLSVSAMCVCNPDRSPLAIHTCDTT